MSLDIPVLLITWRRLDTTRRVIRSLRLVQPKVIYIASDGPRKNNINELVDVENVRRMIAEEINWDCRVRTKFSEINLGCRVGVSSAITWFFQNESMGIILEDDVLPLPEFFNFCRLNLRRHENRFDIFAIGGFSALFTDSPYLSVNGSVWGWATWRDRWQRYEELAPSIDDMQMIKKYCSTFSYLQLIRLIDVMRSTSPIDTWDYWWLFTRIRHQGLTILPPRPLTLNIGFDSGGSTHTSYFDSRIEKINDKASSLQGAKLDVFESNLNVNSNSIRRLDRLRLISRYGRSFCLKRIISLFIYRLKAIFS